MCALMSACGGSSAASKANQLNQPVTPSIKPLDLGTGKADPACQLLSRTGVAQVLGVQLPTFVVPDSQPASDDPSNPSEEIPDCALGKVVNLELEQTTLTHGGCIFRPVDEVRISGRVTCLEYDENLPGYPDYSAEVSISYHGWTDATLTYAPAHTVDHATVRKQLIQLATNLVAATH